MGYDDSLTPEIPTEQLPDVEGTETQVSLNQDVNNVETQVVPNHSINSSVSTAPNTSHTGNASSAEPDLELLAVLLKNPELVFALTSGQACNLSNKETVKLLDMIKAGGAGLSNSFNALDKPAEENVEVSLPSPTPPSNPGTVCYLSPLCNLLLTLYDLELELSTFVALHSGANIVTTIR